MTVRELIERLSKMDPDVRVLLMTELDDPQVQVEAWVTDTAVSMRYKNGSMSGEPSAAIIIGSELDV